MPTVLGTSGDDEPVGVTLARMRRAKGLTGGELAAMIGMSQPKISRIERGNGLPDPRDIGIVARALGADENHIQALMDRAERLHERMTDWRPALTNLADRQKSLADLESEATVIRIFEPATVCGLFQTSGYARAVFQAVQRTVTLATEDITESALLAAVSARLKRQVILADPAKSFQAILGEDVLRRRIYPPAEMLVQINHIRDIVMRHSNVRITVIPDEAPTNLPLMHGFTLIDDKAIVVDLYHTGLISRSGRDVETYHRIFDMLDEHATDIEPILDKYQAIYIKMLQRTRGDQL